MQFVLVALVLTTLNVALTTAEGPAEIKKYLLDLDLSLDLYPYVPPRRKTDQRIAEHGYPVESHKVITEDGYILGVYRIPHSHKLNNQNDIRPIVVLQHGFLGCSDYWLLNGQNHGLPYLLADSGFDVWLANSRGNTYSRNHTIIAPKEPSFWDFSWNEMGYYDLPAVVDYALAKNGQQQNAIHYVGHSQGTSALFVLLSMRPDYNGKFKTIHTLAPIAYMSNMRSPLVKTLAPLIGYHNILSVSLRNKEFLPSNELFVSLYYASCIANSKSTILCAAIASLIGGTESNTNQTAAAYLLESHPAGASTNQLLHYTQEHQSGHFRKFDFGLTKNLATYGKAEPPNYPVELITAELHLWYSNNDDMAAVEDVERFAARLPNKVMHRVEDPSWAHGDFVLAMKVKETINDPIIRIMLQHESQSV